jgi:O-antigen/teichoic acid export membrane protein
MRIVDYLRGLRRIEFVRRVLMLSGATLAGQALVVLALPLLTRLYTPEDFGVFSLYASSLGIITVVAGLRFELAVSLPSDDIDAMHVAMLSAISAIIVSLLSLIALSLAAGFWQPDAGHWLATLQNYRWPIFAGVLVVGLSAALQAWSTRKGRFGLVSKGRLVQAVAGVSAQAGLGALQTSAFGLIIGHLAYCAGGIGIMVRAILRTDNEHSASLSFARLKAMASKYKSFPMYSVPEALFNAAGWYLPILMMTTVVSTDELGQLQLATRVIGLPMALIGASVAQVYLVEAPGKLREGTLERFTRGTMSAMFKTAALPMVLVACVSPIMFPWVFGAEWSRGGQVLAWLAPSYLLQLVASPVGTIMHVTGRLWQAMLLQAIGFLIRIGATWWALAYFPSLTIEFYAVSGGVYYAICIVLIGWVIRRRSDTTI